MKINVSNVKNLSQKLTNIVSIMRRNNRFVIYVEELISLLKLACSPANPSRSTKHQ